MSSSIRWGFVGLGRIAHAFARDLALFEDADLVAVGSRSESNAQSFADEHGAHRAYGSYQAVISDPDVDIVYVATPHRTHADLSIAAMEAGKHVLCEKPVAINMDEAQSMVEAARANNRFFMEALWSRFNPVICEALDRVQHGDIGTVRYVQADFTFLVDEVEGARMHDPEQGGGSLLDMGIYPLFLAYLVLGMPASVTARMEAHATGVDQQMAVILQYPAAMATTYSGFASQSNMQATVSGDEGRLVLHPVWHEPDAYSILKNNAWEGERVTRPRRGHGLAHEIEACHESIRSGLIECPLWTHQDSLNLMQILDQARESAGLTYPFENRQSS